MHAQALQLRHALVRSASRAIIGHLRLLPSTNTAAAFSSAAVAAERATADAEPSPLVRRPKKAPRTSNKQFNLLASANDTNDGNNDKNKPRNGSNNNRYNGSYRKPSKWWKNMDRTSFRKLLDECMASGKVSSVLRKVLAVSLIAPITPLTMPLTQQLRLLRPMNSTWTSTRSRSRCGPRRSSS